MRTHYLERFITRSCPSCNNTTNYYFIILTLQNYVLYRLEADIDSLHCSLGGSTVNAGMLTELPPDGLSVAVLSPSGQCSEPIQQTIIPAN